MLQRLLLASAILSSLPIMPLASLAKEASARTQEGVQSIVPLAASQADPQPKPDTNCDKLSCAEDFPFDAKLLFDIGYIRYGLTDLNKALQAKGYSPFSEHNLLLGGSLQLIFWQFLSEFSFDAGINAPSLNDTFIANMSAGHFLLNFGYQFKPLPQLSIYPLVGVGLGFLDLTFRQRGVLPSFDEVLSNPGRQGHISNLLLTLNAGLGIDWKTDWGFQLGLRGGYLWTPPSNWWQLQDVSNDNSQNNNGQPLAGGPDISLSGPYAKLMVGF
jgi:hypothetical protein